MAWQTGSITDVLNNWADAGVFSYVIPFLLIFAVVYGILSKTKVLGDNNTVSGIVALAVGLLSLQFDFVATFFATIFPRFAVGLAVFLVIIILAGLFLKPGEEKGQSTFYIIGLVIAAAVVLWGLSSWQFWRDSYFIGPWFEENFWSIVLGAGLIIIIALVMKSGATDESGRGKPSRASG